MDFVIDIDKLETEQISDRTVRKIIRYGLANLLAEKEKNDVETDRHQFLEFVEELKQSPIAIQTSAANEQHYEVTSDFFELVLGKRLKYSCCYYLDGVYSLDEAEEAMLELVCDRAQVQDGQEILDLGCGWGSLSLYLAEKYPNSQITGLSNSHNQRKFIKQGKNLAGFDNLNIITADISKFEIDKQFDRIISIEMFEHLRNYEKLLHKISSGMKSDGLLFVHIFTHKNYAYYFEDHWIADNFFTGGIMPSDSLLLYFAKDVSVQKHWRVSGEHYQKTSEAWLKKLDDKKAKVLEIFSNIYGEEKALRMFLMWRLFFIVTAESFGFKDGQEWLVSHYLFEKKILIGVNYSDSCN